MQDLSSEARRLLVAFDLHEAGVAMMRRRLRRENPTLDDRAVEELLRAWLRERPGAPDGDGDGTRVSWPRSAH